MSKHLSAAYYGTAAETEKFIGLMNPVLHDEIRKLRGINNKRGIRIDYRVFSHTGKFIDINDMDEICDELSTYINEHISREVYNSMSSEERIDAYMQAQKHVLNIDEPAYYRHYTIRITANEESNDYDINATVAYSMNEETCRPRPTLYVDMKNVSENGIYAKIRELISVMSWLPETIPLRKETT